MSKEFRRFDAISFDHLLGRCSEKPRHGRQTATDANVLKDRDELFVILSVDFSQLHTPSDTPVPGVCLHGYNSVWCVQGRDRKKETERETSFPGLRSHIIVIECLLPHILLSYEISVKKSNTQILKYVIINQLTFLESHIFAIP